ncbi:MAG: PBSX family phage terminase large subunit [Mycoplasma sp.]|nr:PBSX family phage terminase large subunit [Mycoplasma sp.]
MQKMGLIYSKKQNEFILNCNHRYNFKVGAVRSGKSFVDISFIVPKRILERKGKSGLNLILGVSKESIERNVLAPMREIYTDRLVSRINTNTNIAYICGEPCYCLGAAKETQVGKIQGMSVKYCYGDEVAKWNRNVFVMLQSRLDKNYSCFDGSLNPESPTHWLKKDFLDKPDLDIYIQHYTIFDNPFLPKEFVENLCKEYEGVFYLRYIEGKWALAEGLIFASYERAIKECPFILSEKTFKTMDNFCVSIDYGTMNAFCAILWVKVDSVWWGWRNYYYSGRESGIQKTDEEYAKDVIELVKPLFLIQKTLIEKYKLQYAEKLEVIIDPSAASFITLLKQKKLFKVKKAVNNVLDGIRDMGTAILMDYIKIDPSFKAWEDEAASYHWDEKSVEDRPFKVDDHAMDSCRYFVSTKKLIKNNKKDNKKENDYEDLMPDQRNLYTF